LLLLLELATIAFSPLMLLVLSPLMLLTVAVVIGSAVTRLIVI
jgi:hypothetical protein